MNRDGKIRSVEFILVDDGSKDKTWSIIKEWTKRFPPSKRDQKDLTGDSLPPTKGKIVVRGVQ